MKKYFSEGQSGFYDVEESYDFLPIYLGDEESRKILIKYFIGGKLIHEEIIDLLIDFEKWFNKYEFDWKNNSKYLAMYASDKFHIWFDFDLYNWSECSKYLVRYCWKYINFWWNPDKFNWDFSHILAQMDFIDMELWWNPDKFNWKEGSKYLAIYRRNRFNYWWNPDKFNKDDVEYLDKYCFLYRKIWENQI